MQHPTGGTEGFREVVFQYPRSDRRRCNLQRVLQVRHLELLLSVSSVGSEAMQLVVIASIREPVDFLSVSSVGSEAMQPTNYLSEEQARKYLSVS